MSNRLKIIDLPVKDARPAANMFAALLHDYPLVTRVKASTFETGPDAKAVLFVEIRNGVDPEEVRQHVFEHIVGALTTQLITWEQTGK